MPAKTKSLNFRLALSLCQPKSSRSSFFAQPTSAAAQPTQIWFSLPLLHSVLILKQHYSTIPFLLPCASGHHPPPLVRLRFCPHPLPLHPIFDHLAPILPRSSHFVPRSPPQGRHHHVLALGCRRLCLEVIGKATDLDAAEVLVNVDQEEPSWWVWITQEMV
ncbi:hypothetical protein Droror1_Dr00000611 [Drosera rotundifolia]